MTPKSLIEPARHAGTTLLRSQSDARLVDLTRDGNERAFEAIVQRYSGPLLRYCSRLLPPARAEDAVQHAFLSAHRAIHAGDAELNLRPWLYRIAHNASLNQLRQSGFDHEQVSDEIDGVETPPQAFERGERLRTVVAAVRDLPQRQRDAIVLQAVEGRSYEEIASELGVTDGAVRQLLNRARTTLRDGVTALTPTGLFGRFAVSESMPVAERVAAALAGAGGSALLAKAGATLVVAGAVAGGAAVGGEAGGDPARGGEAQAAVVASGDAGGGGDSGGGVRLLHGGGRDDAPDRGERRERDERRGGGDERRGGDDDRTEESDFGRDESDSGEGDRSGSGDDNDSTPGTAPDQGGGDDSEDRSGSGSGGDDGDDSSGSSGSADDDSSGSGSSGSGGDDSSGSGSSGSGGDDSSGSGSSGSDDDDLIGDSSGSGSSGSGRR